jgi:hypothetical protein
VPSPIAPIFILRLLIQDPFSFCITFGVFSKCSKRPKLLKTARFFCSKQEGTAKDTTVPFFESTGGGGDIPSPFFPYTLGALLRPTGPMYFVFCRLYPSSPQPPRQCVYLLQVIFLSTNTVSRGAGLPIHMIVEVSREPKKEDKHEHLIFDLSMMYRPSLDCHFPSAFQLQRREF